MKIPAIIGVLLKSDEPSIRFKTLINILDEDPGSQKIKLLQKEIKNSARVRLLLQTRSLGGKNIYAKWQGAHWVIAILADIGYPDGDVSLRRLKEWLLNYWLNEYYFKETVIESGKNSYGSAGVPVIEGRFRRCASQHAGVLWSMLKLGLYDKKTGELVNLLLKWQWPDGGWNCDRRPGADTSSFMETIFPLRALSLYSNINKDEAAASAVGLAAEVFLKRKLYKRISDGQIIRPEFTCLHYPLYWHYDILAGLKVMAETGFIKDPRCADALGLLESKVLTGGGFPAEKKYYTKVSSVVSHGADWVSWGGTGKKKMNEWVTVDALYVLKAAGRLF